MRVAGVTAMALLLMGASGVDIAQGASPGGETRGVAARRAAATRALNLASPAYRTAEVAPVESAPAPIARLPAASQEAADPADPPTVRLAPAMQGSLASAGRWYLFAAVRGRSFGLNFREDIEGGAYRTWGSERLAVTADGQIGFGWRKGAHQTSVGYLVRRQRYHDPFLDLIAPHRAEVVAVTYSFSPDPAATRADPSPKGNR